MTVFVLDGVSKQYGPVTAIDTLSITIDSGTFHGVLGPNGSGKTTLFRLLAGIERPTRGRIDRPRTDIGYSFQQPRFYPALTVNENLRIFATFAETAVDSSWLDALCEGLRLSPARHRRAGRLSGGFQQKLDLALALVKRPQYLLLDEPLTDVDAPSRRAIRSFLADYHTPERTIIVSTHDVAAVREHLQTCTVLLDGQLEAHGAIDDDPVGAYLGRVS